MPARINTPFSSTMQPDAFDEGDRFGAELSQRQREFALNRMDQSGWRNNALAEQGREFDIGHGDQAATRRAIYDAHMADLGFAREGLQFQRDSAGKQFDYMAGRDRAEADRWQKQFDAGTAGRAASDAQSGAQTQMVLQALQQMKEENSRHQAARNAPVPADLTSAPQEVQARYQADLASSDPATANSNYATAMHSLRTSEADTGAEALSKRVADFKSRDTSAWDADPTMPEVQALHKQRDDLRDRYIGAGMSPKAALDKANAAIGSLSDANQWRAGWTKALYQELGIR